MRNHSTETRDLLQRVKDGDEHALGQLLMRHRERLGRTVSLRMDRRVNGRIDASDVLQEAYLEAAARIREFLDDPQTSVFVWLRHIAIQKLLELHRRHLGARVRDATRDRSLFGGPHWDASSTVLAAHLLGHDTSPSEVAIRDELRHRLQDALNNLAPVDREIIVLRHFEQLSNVETAQVLGIKESAASSRHVRAIRHLKAVLNSMPEFRELRTDKRSSP